MPSIPSNATPQMLRWARETAGLSAEEVAGLEKIYLEQLERWERGDDMPTLAQLRSLSKRYKRPLMVFYLPAPPTEFSVVKDFRHLPEREAKWSPELTYAIRHAQERQAWASDYLYENGEDENRLLGSLSLASDPRAAAAEFRKLIGVTLTAQNTCENAKAAFRLWREKIEAAGVFVFQIPKIAIEEMRGCALPDKYAPVAIINSADADAAKSFTLIHETAHLLLGESAITGGMWEFDQSPQMGTEAFCNRFAAEVLVPAEAFQKLIPKNWRDRDDEIIESAARMFRVSRAVILFRLLELKFTDRSYIDQKLRSLSSPPVRAPKGGPKQHELALSRLGHSFSRLALAAYQDSSLHAAGLSTLLGLKLKHLPDLERQLFPNQVRPGLGA